MAHRRRAAVPAGIRCATARLTIVPADSCTFAHTREELQHVPISLKQKTGAFAGLLRRRDDPPRAVATRPRVSACSAA